MHINLIIGSLALFGLSFWTGCSRKVEGPVPVPVVASPQVVCNAQLDTWIRLSGSGFSPVPVESLTDGPKLALPQVTLKRSADIDGSNLSSEPDIVLNPEPRDSSNQKVIWTSRERLSFLIYPALNLMRGLYDVTVKNATGGRGTLSRGFTAVPPPVLHSAVPTPICTEQYENIITLNGEWFLVIGNALPTVTIDGVDYVPASRQDCQPVVTPRGDVARCTLLTVRVPVKDLAVGAHQVKVTNPEPANCHSTESVVLHVLPPPRVNTITPQPVCLAQASRALTISGSDFLMINSARPTVVIGSATASVDQVTDCQPVSGLSTTETCNSIDITVAEDALPSGVHPVVVRNPETAQCTSEEAVTLAVVPPPSLVSVRPQPVCTAQGDNVLTLTGSGFLKIGSRLPSVQIDGIQAASVDVSATTCSAVAGTADTVSCTELIATVLQGSPDEGLHRVTVANPLPAGCTSEEAVTLAVVPPPTLSAIAPNPVCLEQGAVMMTLTGSGFLRVGAELPEVTVGGVAVTSVNAAVGSCAPVNGVSAVETCTELTGLLANRALASNGGPYRVNVTNPAPAACSSTENVTLAVVPPPELGSITPREICTGGGVFTITGHNLEGISARMVDSSGGVVLPASVTVQPGGSIAEIAFSSGLRNETYDLHVTGQGGCNDVLGPAVKVLLGPVVFFVDPPVLYNGVAIRATIYASRVTSAPSSVSIAPAGGGAETPLVNVEWSQTRPNRIQGTIPSGLAAGAYDVFVRGVGSCEAVLGRGLSIVESATLALLNPALTPAFGEQNTHVAVSILAKEDGALAAGEVNFKPTPRVYLSSSILETARPLRAVAYEKSNRLASVIPPLQAGFYDLVVVNPDGTVGFQANVYEAKVVPPPAIDAVQPSKIEGDSGQKISIIGRNFFNAQVSLSCSAGSPPTLNIGFSTASLLEVTLNASGVPHGAACTVRVDNTANQTWDVWSALSVTNPSGNLGPFYSGESMRQARRSPAVSFGRATRRSRYLYAIGGDDGSYAGALSSVEVSTLGQFGEIGRFQILQTTLPEGRTRAVAHGLGRFLYLMGGMGTDGSVFDEILRAEILDPLKAPEVSDIDLRFASSGSGLPAGAWIYKVAAVFSSSDGENPNGESLPSDPLTVYAPQVPDGVEIELTWKTVNGAGGGAPAASYYIYRTTSVNETVEAQRLMAVVPGTAAATHSFTDLNPGTFANPHKVPLDIGALGQWHPTGRLNTPRASYGFIEAAEPGCAARWYLFGGITNAASATESVTYEVADVTTGALGAFNQHMPTGTISARRELAVWVANNFNSPGTGLNACDYYFYVGPGASGSLSTPDLVSNVRVSTYSGASGGLLGAFTNAMGAGAAVKYIGYAAFWSGTFVYAMGGGRGSPPTLSSDVTEGAWNSGDEPEIKNWNDSTIDMKQARYLYGHTRVGAFNYLVGGLSQNNQPTATTEYNIR